MAAHTPTIPRVEVRPQASQASRLVYWVPLALILAAQIVQSARLLPSPVSFDEARCFLVAVLCIVIPKDKDKR